MASTFLSASVWNDVWTPSGVSMSMSVISSASGRPLTPPAALISSIAIWVPFEQSLWSAMPAGPV